MHVDPTIPSQILPVVETVTVTQESAYTSVRILCDVGGRRRLFTRRREPFFFYWCSRGWLRVGFVGSVASAARGSLDDDACDRVVGLMLISAADGTDLGVVILPSCFAGATSKRAPVLLEPGMMPISNISGLIGEAALLQLCDHLFRKYGHGVSRTGGRKTRWPRTGDGRGMRVVREWTNSLLLVKWLCIGCCYSSRVSL